MVESEGDFGQEGEMGKEDIEVISPRRTAEYEDVRETESARPFGFKELVINEVKQTPFVADKLEELTRSQSMREKESEIVKEIIRLIPIQRVECEGRQLQQADVIYMSGIPPYDSLTIVTEKPVTKIVPMAKKVTDPKESANSFELIRVSYGELRLLLKDPIEYQFPGEEKRTLGQIVFWAGSESPYWAKEK